VGEGVSVPVNQRQQWILSRIQESGSIQMKTIRNRFKDLSVKTSKRDIEQLKELGLIIFLGAPKTGKYVLTEKGKKNFKVVQ
jgi:ATP-dependent DNA helicase RecG